MICTLKGQDIVNAPLTNTQLWVQQGATQCCQAFQFYGQGPIHTGRATRRKANGTCCCQWECSHCTQATSKEKKKPFEFVRASRPASCVDWASQLEAIALQGKGSKPRPIQPLTYQAQQARFSASRPSCHADM